MHSQARTIIPLALNFATGVVTNHTFNALTMLQNKPLKLSVATARDFAVPLGIFSLLVLFAAALSPLPASSTLLAILLLSAGWSLYILRFLKVNSGILTAVIYADGQVCLQSEFEETRGGVLIGQQWSTNQLAVLRVGIDGIACTLIILGAQQANASDFRRLTMWVRQGSYSGASEKQASRLVLDTEPE